MGEATYYLKAEFPAGVDIVRIRNDFGKLLDELAVFFSNWQAVRDSRNETPAERVAKLKERFPHVWEEFRFGDLEVKEDDAPLNPVRRGTGHHNRLQP